MEKLPSYIKHEATANNMWDLIWNHPATYEVKFWKKILVVAVTYVCLPYVIVKETIIHFRKK